MLVIRLRRHVGVYGAVSVLGCAGPSRESGSHVESATQLSLAPHFHVDALIKAELDEIERLLDGSVVLRHAAWFVTTVYNAKI